MKRTLIITAVTLFSINSFAQIKNVIEKSDQAIIELESGDIRRASIHDGYLAGWNSKIVVIVNHSDERGGRIYMCDKNGNIVGPGTLGKESLDGVKITVTANSIVVNRKSGKTVYFDLKGEPKD